MWAYNNASKKTYRDTEQHKPTLPIIKLGHDLLISQKQRISGFGEVLNESYTYCQLQDYQYYSTFE